MQYQVVLLDNPNRPIIVEASEFHTQGGGGVTFFADRNRLSGGNDQWGNPRRQRQRTTVAFFNNVQSVIEMTEANTEGDVGFGLGGEWPTAEPMPFIAGAPWGDNGPNMVGRDFPAPVPVSPVIRVDDDGVNWDAQRDD